MGDMASQIRKVVVLGKVWPEPNSSAAGSRMLQLIEQFLAVDWDVVFASTAQKTSHSVDLAGMGIREARIAMNDSAFDGWIRQEDPQLVLFDRFMVEEQFGWRVAEHCPKALRLLDTEDLHALRQARHQAVKEGREMTRQDLFNETAVREVASIYRCDLSLMISAKEIEVLQEVFGVPKSLLHELPFMLDPVEDATVNDWPTFEERRHFVTIGNFRHAPNWDAVRYLKADIWPLIRKQLPDAQMHVFGSYPSPKVYQLHNEREGFLIKGRADSAEEVMRKARVCLAPLRFGAGLKGKLITAMQNGTPSVTTSIGAESMRKGEPWAGAIADDPESFANQAVRLYTDASTWEQAQKNGEQILNRHFDKREWGPAFMGALTNLFDQLDTHRLKNFTGRMLQHHSLASTKFMSKWIEAKNL
jgi:hypothetical protein